MKLKGWCHGNHKSEHCFFQTFLVTFKYAVIYRHKSRIAQLLYIVFLNIPASKLAQTFFCQAGYHRVKMFAHVLPYWYIGIERLNIILAAGSFSLYVVTNTCCCFFMKPRFRPRLQHRVR